MAPQRPQPACLLPSLRCSLRRRRCRCLPPSSLCRLGALRIGSALHTCSNSKQLQEFLTSRIRSAHFSAPSWPDFSVSR